MIRGMVRQGNSSGVSWRIGIERAHPQNRQSGKRLLVGLRCEDIDDYSQGRDARDLRGKGGPFKEVAPQHRTIQRTRNSTL